MKGTWHLLEYLIQVQCVSDSKWSFWSCIYQSDVLVTLQFLPDFQFLTTSSSCLFLFRFLFHFSFPALAFSVLMEPAIAFLILSQVGLIQFLEPQSLFWGDLAFACMTNKVIKPEGISTAFGSSQWNTTWDMSEYLLNQAPALNTAVRTGLRKSWWSQFDNPCSGHTPNTYIKGFTSLTIKFDIQPETHLLKAPLFYIILFICFFVWL